MACDVAISGFVLEGTPSVGSASIDASGLTLTVSGSPVGADLVADLTTLLGEITLRPPEDFSGDATITARVTAQESGAEPSTAVTSSYTASVTAVAEAAVVTVANLSGDEDDRSSLQINDQIINAISQDDDNSETIASYSISGLVDGENSFVLVDAAGDAVGVSDGSGGTTISAAEFAAGVFIEPPADFHGQVSLGVSVTTKETGSTSTAVSSESTFTVSISPIADAASITVPDSSTPIQILEYTGSGDYEAIALNSSVVPANEDEALSIFVAVQKNGLNVATLLNGQTGITALSNADIQSQMHSDAQALINANYTVYSIADTDTLSNLTFIPPASAVNADFSVKVITQSLDADATLSESDTAVSHEEISYNIIEVAKAPTVTFNGGSVSEGDALQLDALEKTSSASENIIDIPLQVTASGSDVVTVLLTGVSDDFVFYEVDGATETIVGARNETGTVFIFQVSEGFSTSEGSTFKTKVDPAFVTSDPDGDGVYETLQNFNFTAFAVDSSGAGTTASTNFSAQSRIYGTGADPILIDFGAVDGLDDNFGVAPRLFDINADNAGETPDERVFLPDSDVGILVYNTGGLADNTYLSMVDHVFSERFEYQGKTANSSFDALLLLDSSGDGHHWSW